MLVVQLLLHSLAAPDSYTLATFGTSSSPKTVYNWFEQNDPVMGGSSVGNWSVVSDYGVFQGTVKNVSFLHAPGYCRVVSTVVGFHDVSSFIKGGIAVTFRTQILKYAGFKLAFSAVGTPEHHGGHEAEGMFKQSFQADPNAPAGVWQTAYLPFNGFSWDWSDFTGECSTIDPSDGYQHRCCSAANPGVCPTSKLLHAVDGFSIWSEGVGGEFQMDVQKIEAVLSGPGPPPGTVCAMDEYCCPDVNHCLSPSGITGARQACSAASDCAKGETCCPLTKMCVAIGGPCTPPPVCSSSEYCCPDAKHCLTPVHPGQFCSATVPGTQGSCSSSQICCPLTNECVAVGPACVAP